MTSPLRHSAVFAVALVLVAATVARADVVLDWNAIAIRTVTQPPVSLNPFFQARALSVVQLAVFDAVNAVTGEYRPYTDAVVPVVGASAEAAAAAAAHKVLVTYYPAVAAALDADFALTLAAIPDGPAEAAGIAVGEAAAQALMDLRSTDGAFTVDPYVPTSTAPGEWQPTPTPVGAPACTAGVLRQWATLTPFAIAGAASFIPGPPPALSSNQYAKDFNEVLAVGGVGSTARPADRSLVARFYAATSPSQLLNTAARQLATERGDSLSQNAQTLALLNVAVNDSFIVSFATKYTYTFWRPVTAIRNADVDGNAKTDVDVTFTPFITTPCFPSYPSNHASGTNAGLEVLRRAFGAAGHAIEITALGVTLRYAALEQIADDIDDARIYGGIHFRFDQEAGGDIGRAVGTYVSKNLLNRVVGEK